MDIHGTVPLTGWDWTSSAVLVFCLVMFIAIIVWALTRSRREIEQRARLPLDSDGEGTLGT